MATVKLRPTRAFKQRLEFLTSGNIYLKSTVRIITISYKTNEVASKGLREFICKKLPPLQYKNPRVQMVLFKNTYHHQFPAIKLYFNDARCVLLDVYDKHPDTILKEIADIAGKTEEQVQKAKREAEYNPANFGDARRSRLCICEVPGQIPCPSKVPVKKPDHAWHRKEGAE